MKWGDKMEDKQVTEPELITVPTDIHPIYLSLVGSNLAEFLTFLINLGEKARNIEGIFVAFNNEDDAKNLSGQYLKINVMPTSVQANSNIIRPDQFPFVNRTSNKKIIQ
jgi:hypothetical protein